MLDYDDDDDDNDRRRRKRKRRKRSLRAFSLCIVKTARTPREATDDGVVGVEEE